MLKVALWSLLALCLALTAVEGRNRCEIRGKGKLKSFSRNKVSIKLPCKYKAAEFKCQGYKIRVAPSQKLDGRSRYYVSSAWISIKSLDTDYYWSGRISAQTLIKYFNETNRELFMTKKSNLEGAPFSMQFEADQADLSATVGVTRTGFKVVFYAYVEDDKERRKAAGVEIVCPEGDFTNLATYPQTICGNDTDAEDIALRRKEMGLGSKTKSIIHDILLSEEVSQTSAECDIASRVYRECAVDQIQTIKDCGALITSGKLMKCLDRKGYDPMEQFNYCLKYKCEGDPHSCVLMQEALDSCPNTMAVATEVCPAVP